MKKQLFTLTATTLLTIGLSACGSDTRTSSTTETETMQSADQAVTVTDSQTTQDKYGKTNTVVKHSQAYMPSEPVVRKTTTTNTSVED